MFLRQTALVALILAGAFTAAGAVSVPGVAEAQGRRALQRTDTNGDGKISLQEFLASRGRLFDQIDTDHDGVLTKDEVAAYEARLESAAAGAMIRSGKERKEGGGQVERMAELTAGGPLPRARWDAMMTKRFERMDVQHLGYLTMDQMRGGRAKGTAATAAMAPMPPAASPQP